MKIHNEFFFASNVLFDFPEAAIPPWVGYNEEETMKNQILALSTVSRENVKLIYFIV